MSAATGQGVPGVVRGARELLDQLPNDVSATFCQQLLIQKPYSQVQIFPSEYSFTNSPGGTKPDKDLIKENARPCRCLCRQRMRST